MSIATLRNSNNGVYAKHIRDWSDEGPDGKALVKHTGIKMYVGAFDVYGQKTQKRKL